MTAEAQTGARYVVMVEVAVWWQGRYLMLIRGGEETFAVGLLSPPGGGIDLADDGEEVLERAARREVEEETGLVVGDRLEYVESHSFVTDDGDAVIDIVFLAVPTGIASLVIDATEADGYRWLTADEVEVDPLVPPWTRRSIRLAERRRLDLGS